MIDKRRGEICSLDPLQVDKMAKPRSDNDPREGAQKRQGTGGKGLGNKGETRLTHNPIPLTALY